MNQTTKLFLTETPGNGRRNESAKAGDEMKRDNGKEKRGIKGFQGRSGYRRVYELLISVYEL